jgi:hypothetical protein
MASATATLNIEAHNHKVPVFGCTACLYVARNWQCEACGAWTSTDHAKCDACGAGREPHKAARKKLILEALQSVPGKWWTLPELADYAAARGHKMLHTSVSARVRDLRRPPTCARIEWRYREGSRMAEYGWRS